MESQSIVKASELLAAAPAVAQEAASTTSASTSASSSSASAANATATVAATAPSASGNADADGAGSDNDVDDDDAAAPGADGAASAAKKKKKKNKKKKNKGLGGGVAGTGPGTPSGGYPITELLPEDPKRPVDVIMLGVGKAPTASASTDGTEPAAPRKDVHGRVQTSPPQIPVSYFYPDYVFPPGERMEYAQDWNLFRTTSEEKRAAELPNETVYNEVREAAEAHRIARQDIQKYLRPGVSLFDIATQLESSTARLMRKNPALYGVSRGWAFPTGLSLNHIAAHWSPNAGDKTVLGVNDVLKVDFGTQVNGRIIDSAFTVHFNHEYDGLVDACKDATETGVRVAGVDMRLGDIGGAIQEVMESYETEIRGKTYGIKCIKDLCGHSIEPYKIHGGKSVPIVNNHDQTKMCEGEFYAIETFGSTGRGHIAEDGEVSHYMRNFNAPPPGSRMAPRARALFDTIDKNFSTLAFCRRWLDQLGEERYLLPMRQLVDADIIRPYPPLVEAKGTYTAQFEHTILLRPTCKEVISRGFDY